jgi:hypothetical protein
VVDLLVALNAVIIIVDYYLNRYILHLRLNRWLTSHDRNGELSQMSVLAIEVRVQRLSWVMSTNVQNHHLGAGRKMFFTCLFALEALAKLFAFGPQTYATDVKPTDFDFSVAFIIIIFNNSITHKNEKFV